MGNANNIAAWRERIFSSLLAVVLVVGAISTVAIIPFLVQHAMWPVALADTLALVWMFAIWRLRRLSYTVRVLNFLAVVYVLAIVLMLSVGSASLSYLLGPPLIAAILLNLRSAMIATGLGVAALIVAGATGHIALNMPGMGDEPLKASLVAAINYSTVSSMLSLACSMLLKGLSRSLGELELTSAAVARLNDMVIIATAGDSPKAVQPIIFANDAFLRRTGYQRDDIVGRDMHALRGPETDHAIVARIYEAMATNQPCQAELTIYTRAGEAFWVEVEVMPFAREGVTATHWVLVGRDITERRAAAEAIHRLAYYDVLTGLPNRRLLMERLGTMLAAGPAGQGLGAVLYLDIDNFKNVNDARGHATGDVLLEHAAARLHHALNPDDMVARIGGDEFVILLENLGADPAIAARTALATANLVRNALALPLELEGQPFRIGASIGVALTSRDGVSAHDLLREADTAMYHAKAGGRDGVMLFECAMLVDAQRRLALERELAVALDNGELAMHFQLQVDHQATPVGAELLMRWRRADGSMVRPDHFIPVAEASSLIIPLGHWVLREACAAWHALDEIGRALPLSINVSPVQFRQPDFVEKVQAILAETGAPASQLIFEVTEGLLIEDIDQTLARMHQLTALGIRFSVDDFGTGYSNLAYLKKMPLYELKIDKSFMQEAPQDHNSTAIVQSILSMAGHLGLRVVAEGIETEAQAAYLAQQGGACMQGFLYHRPMPLALLIEQLGQRPQAPAAAMQA
ncbi:PAS domain S-box-containing protein/diguanylate cyclase (GGDEF)-like protein [Pseudoduganella lurida]|uniref:PAS domain S-box-containing protein/diguanylate cyclase (GGDEF)-like protein n=1 Tax=Pseudoduganella lurida TaxID=1036180 RepID=A0A562R955_9BURK|nr:EAL domain-containing protein [Pseudoduganella lurida]TWI65423.1 PAS domain S-box-containing protein/diguanylate cyclase (GGDEF)-like protein [Pseudoduganella lurida]